MVKLPKPAVFNNICLLRNCTDVFNLFYRDDFLHGISHDDAWQEVVRLETVRARVIFLTKFVARTSA